MKGHLEFKERCFLRQEQWYTRDMTGKVEQTLQKCSLGLLALTWVSQTHILLLPSPSLVSGVAPPIRALEQTDLLPPHVGWSGEPPRLPPPPQAVSLLAAGTSAHTNDSSCFCRTNGLPKVSIIPILNYRGSPGPCFEREREHLGRGSGRALVRNHRRYHLRLLPSPLRGKNHRTSAPGRELWICRVIYPRFICILESSLQISFYTLHIR